MLTSFEGQTRSRRAINLGGSARVPSSSSSSSSSSQSTAISATASSSTDNVAQRARAERQYRQQQRRLDAHARRIQSFYRSRREAAAFRQAVRSELDVLLEQAIQTATQELEHAQLLLGSAVRLAFVYRQRNTSDNERLAKWARMVATGKPVIDLFHTFQVLHRADEDASIPQNDSLYRWCQVIRRLTVILLRHTAVDPKSPSNFLYLELVKQLLDPAKYATLDIPASLRQTYATQIATTLLAHDAYSHVRQHILSQTKLPAITLSPCVAIFIGLLNQRSDIASQPFLTEILTIPRLLSSPPSARLPTSALANLIGPNAKLAFWDIITEIPSAVQDLLRRNDNIQRIASLLSNLILLCKPRLVVPPPAASTSKVQTPNSQTVQPGPRSAKDYIALLAALSACTDAIPADALTTPSRDKTVIDLTLDGADDVEMQDARSTSESLGSKAAAIDPAVTNTLSTISSDTFLSPLIALSNMYSASSRPALSAFLVSLLYAWPSQRENMVNTLVYSSASATRASGGLLRELWRGYVRSSPLSRALSAATAGKSGTSSTAAVLSTMSNISFVDDWPHLILLAELYVRTLLTLGDDEFFASSVPPPSANARSTTQHIGARNPLSIDEVVGLSTLFRNVAFALYWQPDSLRDKSGQHNHVANTKVPLEALRKLATNLLQMLYVRDSRRNFTPPNHWIMVSQAELRNFVETTILDEQSMESDIAMANMGASGSGRMEVDSDDEMPRPLATYRRNVPSKAVMSRLSPRLGVLNNIPFVIPFGIRVSIFQQFIANDKQRSGILDRRPFAASAARIRRGHVADDGFSALNPLGSRLKERLAIQFIDQYGQEEAGIDGGGLFKEFLTDLSKEAFDINRGLWLETSNRELYPTATSYSREAFQLQWYAFLGRVMGKALYEGILVDVPFAPFFLSKWLGRSSGFDDLASFDPDLYHGLVDLKNYAGDVEKDMSLNFTVNDDDFGVSKTIELVRNGAETAVTNENRIAYIYRVSDYRLNKQVAPQCAAFFSGLSDLIDPKWLRMFNQIELGLLVGGAETSIDVDDLRHNTVYSQDYNESHETVQYFWKVVSEFSPEERKALVKFATSCPRPPLLGFGQLNPRFAIANGGPDETRLPTASTCVNLLKLPRYSSPDMLRQKLKASINSGAGFDLS